jgi:hypothetical protein
VARRLAHLPLAGLRAAAAHASTDAVDAFFREARLRRTSNGEAVGTDTLDVGGRQSGRGAGALDATGRQSKLDADALDTGGRQSGLGVGALDAGGRRSSPGADMRDAGGKQSKLGAGALDAPERQAIATPTRSSWLED